MHKPFFDTLFVGRSIIELERTDSTNNFAAKLLNTQKPAEGTAIMTHIQEAGKGQRGNTWQSEAHKNLTVSFIFYPTFVSANNQFTLNIAISLGLHDYFKAEFEDRVKIKWPNDLYIDHKKVAGILIENIWSGSGLKSSIVGLGININQESFSEDLQKAASKKSFSGKEYPLKEELHAVSSFLEARYLQLKAGKLDLQRVSYINALYQYQEVATYQSGDLTFQGKIQDITADGKLCIHKEDGTEGMYDLKEIIFR